MQLDNPADTINLSAKGSSTSGGRVASATRSPTINAMAVDALVIRLQHNPVPVVAVAVGQASVINAGDAA